jgi:large subunit ribosomal protein L10
MNKSEKGLAVEELKVKFEKARAVVFTDYKGMTVAEMTALRTQLRKSDIEYQVVKNTLAKIAAKGTAVEAAAEVFKGPVAVAIGCGDPVAVPKKVFGYAKENGKLKVLNGLIEGLMYGGSDLKKVSELPSREVLLSQLAGCMSAPLSKLAAALQATLGGFVNAMTQLKEKKGAS